MKYKLESLRGVAACLVVLFHSPFNYGNEGLSFSSNSYLFVDFFFILSGFLMSLNYYSRINEGLGFRKYTLLRLGRIYPLHLITLILWVPYILIKQYMFESGFGETTPLEKNNPMSFFSNVLLLNSMGMHDYLSWNYPSWSISTEFFTYIVFFWLTLKVDKKSSISIPLAISAGCYCFLTSIDESNFEFTYDYGFFRCLGAFYIGVFVDRLSKIIQIPEKIKNNFGILETTSLVSVVIFVSIADLYFLYFIPVIAFFAATVFIFSKNESGIWGEILLTKPLRNIGTWSYSIYMIHAIVLGVFEMFFEHILKSDIDSPLGIYSLAINLIALLLIIALSKHSYLLIEKPLRDQSRKLAKKL